jgi:hypothetical protein
MVTFRVVKVAPASLAALDLDPPKKGKVGIGRAWGNSLELDVDIAALEERKDARIISRPMIMVHEGVDAEIESSGSGSRLTLRTRVRAQPEGLRADVAMLVSGGDGESLKVDVADIDLPASVVRCPDVGDCLVVFVDAQVQR